MTSWILIYVREDSSVLIPSLMLNPSGEDISTIRHHLLGWCLLGTFPILLFAFHATTTPATIATAATMALMGVTPTATALSGVPRIPRMPPPPPVPEACPHLPQLPFSPWPMPQSPVQQPVYTKPSLPQAS